MEVILNNAVHSLYWRVYSDDIFASLYCSVLMMVKIIFSYNYAVMTGSLRRTLTCLPLCSISGSTGRLKVFLLNFLLMAFCCSLCCQLSEAVPPASLSRPVSNPLRACKSNRCVCVCVCVCVCTEVIDKTPGDSCESGREQNTWTCVCGIRHSVSFSVWPLWYPLAAHGCFCFIL